MASDLENKLVDDQSINTDSIEEYDNEEESTNEIPEDVEQFLSSFSRINESSESSDVAFYDSNFAKLTERHYKDRAWPSPEKVSAILDGSFLFS